MIVERFEEYRIKPFMLSSTAVARRVIRMVMQIYADVLESPVRDRQKPADHACWKRLRDLRRGRRR